MRDASEMAGSVLKSPEARFLNFEARFSPSFLDAPAWIELRGFEAGGGGEASGNTALKEGEDKAMKQDGASSKKQKQNFYMLIHQDVEEVSSMNKPSSTSVMERLTIQPTLALIELVSQ
jgi:hypothetical protein